MRLSAFFMLSKKQVIITCFIVFILFVPELFTIQAPTLRGYWISCIFNLLFYLSIVYVINIILFVIERRFNKRVGLVLQVLFHIVVYWYSFITVFLYFIFHLVIQPETFEVLKDTNESETLGFITTYCCDWLFGLIVGIYGLIAFVELIIIRNYYKLIWIPEVKKVSPIIKILGTIVLLFMITEIRYFAPKYSISRIQYDNVDRWIIRTGLWKTFSSYYKFLDFEKQLNYAIDSQSNLQINKVDYKSSNIVLIIGESHNKHHSNLYGYGLETNPFLSKEPLKFVFNDVIAPYNITVCCFKCFLSLSSVNDSLGWYETPLFPAIFKACGYNVVFYSNWFFPMKEDSHLNENSPFMCHPKIASKNYNVINSEWERFDLGLVDKYRSNIDTFEKDSLNLVIFHLNGQHVPANDKYPSTEKFFSYDDINRPDLTEAERLEIAEYDNACLYNDKVIHEIIELYRQKDAIIIYFSDHGDEINDYRKRVGRTYDYYEMAPEGIHCQFDVPFIVVPTEKYAQNHPDIINALEQSTDKPFMTDDLPHMLLELAGIDSNWFCKEKSIINPAFNTKRHRIIYNTTIDYDVRIR